ncbi:HAD-IA family hydrolase [Panacibacter ginsenosidivorans]|uniref:HAD-IA family hydrolase n=1 Tax=Panacibacter ginsenosidivorans TaxID=1813871 RepID=A0A5B8V8F9_9BACT|nr:HAD-IA family hydrolase [Panacibacter ginsenosidivorans]QEC67121.1 HAD-IA family hydrolase [Panacibacter ginsenosidivorans]
MYKNIQLVVFDIAGTTVRDNGEIAAAFHDAMKERGYDIPHEKIYPLMGYKKPEAIRMMLEEYESDVAGITAEYINIIHDRFIELMVQYYYNAPQLEPLPHAEEIFAWLKAHDIKVGLDTGFSTHITNVIIERLRWLKDGKIDYVVCSNEVPAGRPQPYMIQKMMQAAGVADPKHVIKIGDTEVDVNEGKNAGCLYSIGITTGAFTGEALLPYHPDFIIDDLKELIGIIEK